MNSQIEVYREEINKQLANPETLKSLIATTFKNLSDDNVRQALLEGMMRGFSFKQFLEGDIYAVPFSSGYSLVTSIDYARKIAMKSGIAGKSAPSFTMKPDGKVESCTITVKKKLVDGTLGEFTATVYFDEYTTGKNLWTSKPRTMIAKVAEMHALRMACPEELAQSYVEEERQKSDAIPADKAIDVTEFKAKLAGAKNVDDLKKVWAGIPIAAKQGLNDYKEELKAKLI